MALAKNNTSQQQDHQLGFQKDISLNPEIEVHAVGDVTSLKSVDAYLFVGDSDPSSWQVSHLYTHKVASLYQLRFQKVLSSSTHSSTNKSDDGYKGKLTSFEHEGVLYMVFRSDMVALLDQKKAIYPEQCILAKISSSIKNFAAKKVAIDGSRLSYQADYLGFPALWQIMFHLQVNFYQLPSYNKKAEGSMESHKNLALYYIPPVKEKSLNFSFERGMESFCGFGKASNFIRHMMVEPANRLTPRSFVSCVRRESERLGLAVTFYDYAELKDMGAGAFCAVAGAHVDSGAGIIKVSYTPQKDESSQNQGGMRFQNIVFVGKGITFDSGGVNVKPANYMRGMKNDMTGASVAFAMVRLASEQKWPVKVTSYLAVADNLISASAYKPDDVVTSLSGLTIEIVHTDAEGRMILADTLTLASGEKPDLLMDFATLTGSSVRAISRRYSSVFTNRSVWHQSLIDAGRQMGERVWPFPLDEDFGECLKSSVADTMQCSPSVGVDHIEAAMFLQKFVGDGIPWVHLDLSSARTYSPMGAYVTKETGFAPRFVSDFIRRLQVSKKEDFSDMS
ncbi:MAG: leucyl aminopeptidase family protein [Proteobacteria bacterium]|nr:leucyl aminopeptidase family protein [Pseudomonadota bacterium]